MTKVHNVLFSGAVIMSHKMNSLLQWNQCGERFCGGSVPDVGELVLGEGPSTENVQTLQNRGGNP